ncbi:MAG: DUF3107 domain-containing protein [Actinomycetales bacterium]|nr:DUF3107 domain-containing protein [Actinomycetales bacterium]
MEVKIGIQHVVRELTVETDKSSEDVLSQFNKAVEDDRVFTLVDSKGHTVAVPALKIAYLHITEDTGRKVGFGL